MQSSNVCLVVLVGIPAAGKTSFCLRALDYFHRQTELRAIHICYDDLCVDHTSAGRKDVFIKIAKLVSDSTRKEGSYVFLIDDNNYYKSMRAQYFNLAKQLVIGCTELFFKTDLQVALQRNNERSHDKVPDYVINDMFAKIDGCTNVVDSNFPLSNEIFITLHEKIVQCLKCPLKIIPLQGKEVQGLTKVQKIDLLLRKIVKEKITKDKCNGKKCSVIKNRVLTDVRNGNVKVENLGSDELECLLYSFFNEL